MKLCLAQINPTIAHFELNSDKILRSLAFAHENKCDLVLCPELSLFGYWPSDLLDQQHLVDQQISFISKIQKVLNKMDSKAPGLLFGAVTKNPNSRGRSFYNTAVFLERNKKPQFFYKELLPNYDVFDEKRHFSPGFISNNILKFKNKKILITICEDIWAWGSKGKIHTRNPFEKWKTKVDLILNISASPHSYDKISDREFVVAETAKKLKSPLVYVNQVGAQDEIIFDGGSLAVDAKGKKIFQGKYFEESLEVLDLSKPQKKFEKPKSLQLLKQALVLGIRDFVQKNNFKKVHLGLSGGIDSALVACLAVEALGARNVVCIALPGPYSSQMSFDLAMKLAENLGVEFLNIDVNGIYKSFYDELEVSLGIREFGLVHENLQSRIRGSLLMAYSNFKNSLLLTTGNKAEYAMGYATLYGDMCGGLAPIGDLLKSQVVELCRLINSQKQVIPEEIISRPPTAELRENQKDEDSLPPYKQLDPMVEKFIVQNKKPATDLERDIYRRIQLAEFKRKQSAPILRVSDKAFGSGRRYPITRFHN